MSVNAHACAMPSELRLPYCPSGGTALAYVSMSRCAAGMYSDLMGMTATSPDVLLARSCCEALTHCCTGRRGGAVPVSSTMMSKETSAAQTCSRQWWGVPGLEAHMMPSAVAHLMARVIRWPLQLGPSGGSCAGLPRGCDSLGVQHQERMPVMASTGHEPGICSLPSAWRDKG